KYPEARQRHGEVEDIADVAAVGAREDQQRDDAAEQAAVDGHAAFPDAQRIPGILRPEGPAVEQHIADTTAQDAAEHGVEDEIVNVVRLPGAARLGRTASAEPPARGKADEVHDAVPVNPDRPHAKERANLERDFVEAGELEHV